VNGLTIASMMPAEVSVAMMFLSSSVGLDIDGDL
jgi:hypothetical protein